ncbi:MAG: response regulator transcription factor [Filomicrobium sp.]
MKILIVEDDTGIGRFLRNGLLANGFDVDWVQSGAQLVKRVSSGNYAAVVLDLMLPDADGFSLCQELRSAGITTPICMLTARDSLEDKLEGFRSGADDYLTKPFAVDELVARLRAIARRDSALGAASVLRHGDVVIDLLAHEARVGDDVIDLTPREFSVLLFLARHAGQAVSRERILQAAWGMDAEVTPNTVDVYVGYLRRKLKAKGVDAAITTVRGIGFKFS